jgi:SMODS-associating 2TM, beta-strand rich effector domain
VFGVLYWVFDRFAWRWPFLNAVIKVPDVAGEWICDGQAINQDGSPGRTWQATVTILQSWDKIRVRLKTAQSGSDSIAAALICDDADGYRLLYNYRNNPKIGEVELKSHLGFSELVFARNLNTAEGEYFNGHGRYTFGTMKLKRK